LNEQIAVVVLAAGLGTRMKSNRAKVLHELMGRPMILYVVESAKQVAADVIIVTGHQSDTVQSVVSAHATVCFAYQAQQRGTGHAVQTALPHLKDAVRHVLILSGDVPLLTGRTIARLVADHETCRSDITLLAVDMAEPTGYGRVLLDGNRNVLRIVEEADATPDQKRIRTINSGIYCIRKETLLWAIPKIRPDNAQGEFYLTDIIEIGRRFGKAVGVVFGEDPEEITGVNTLDDLDAAHRILQKRQMKTS